MSNFLREMTFWKFLVTIIFCTGALWAKIDTHMADGNLHTDENESNVLHNIIADGFPYSIDEKLINETRLSLLEDDVQEIKDELEKMESNGQLQTPREKRKLIREVVELYLSEYNKNNQQLE